MALCAARGSPETQFIPTGVAAADLLLVRWAGAATAAAPLVESALVVSETAMVVIMKAGRIVKNILPTP